MSSEAKNKGVWISQVYDKVDSFSRARDFKMFWKKAKFNGIVHAWRSPPPTTRNFDYGKIIFICFSCSI